MKKNFNLNDEKISRDRRVDAIKHEIRKYMKRERNKALPKDSDHWQFDCRYGASEATAETIRPGDIDKCIADAVSSNLDTFYLEILARPARRSKQETEKNKPET